MASRTLTNTVWGEVSVERQEDRQVIICYCKSCFEKTTLKLPLDVNPFDVAKVEHKVGCRFGIRPEPTAVIPLPGMEPVVVPPVVLPVGKGYTLNGVTLLLLVVILMLLAFIGGRL